MTPAATTVRTHTLIRGDSPLVISLPHVGTLLPEDLAPQLSAAARTLPDTDWHVDQLYDFAFESGYTVLRALHSRYLIDLNRPPDDAPLYPGSNTSGLCPTLDFAGEPIWAAGDMPVPAAKLVEMMFGQVITIDKRLDVPLGDPVLQLDHLTLKDSLLTIEDLCLDVHEGEVIGLAGLEGSGQRLMLRACVGLLDPHVGDVWVKKQKLTRRTYHKFLTDGVHYLPAGRLEEGLVQGMSITEHFVLSGKDRQFFIDWKKAEDHATQEVKHYSIKGRPASTVESLSGGNQQRVLLAMFPEKLKLLLMEHPTRGLDIESANWVWTQILKRREDGTAIIFASADLDELLQYSDRIMVFFAGRVLKVVNAKETTVDELGFLIGGKEV